MPKDPAGHLIPGRPSPMRAVPAAIARPEYVGRAAPSPNTGGWRTGGTSPAISCMKGSIFGQPVSTTLKWPTLSAMALNCAVSRGPVVQYRSKNPRM